METMASDVPKHYPVLLKEIISIITPHHGGTFRLYWTSGYTKQILKFKDTKVIGLDRDIKSETYSIKIKNKFPDRFIFKSKV